MAESTQAEQVAGRLREGIASSAEIELALGVTQSWASRALRKLVEEGVVLRLGSTRGTRYGLRREIAGIGLSWPLRRVDGEGQIHELGTLHALAKDQYFFEPTPEAIAADFAWSGISDGIPYFLQDQRPGGFLGRAVPLRYPELQLPQRVNDWNDDHYLRYLTQRGSDTVGDLILGMVALDEYLAGRYQQSVVSANEREFRYPQLATEVMRGGLPGSSMQGEYPKFTASIRENRTERPMLVKFSPPVKSPVGQRWSDLLVAEHHAHRVLRDAGVLACESRVERIGERMYLEVDRFDRQGARGRIGVSSLFAIDATQYGGIDHWIAAATRLRKDGRIDAQTLEQVRLIATFGTLIANTDQHFGNLAFYDEYNGRFRLAPVYDMLPMMFAPQHDQIIARTFESPRPNAQMLAAWGRARQLAQQYWETLAADERISDEFRRIAGQCFQAVRSAQR